MSGCSPCGLVAKIEEGVAGLRDDAALHGLKAEGRAAAARTPSERTWPVLSQSLMMHDLLAPNGTPKKPTKHPGHLA